MSYTQLTEVQRYQLDTLQGKGYKQCEIAEAIGVHASTVSRELRRNRGQRGYRPKQAHEKAMDRRHGSKKACRLTQSLKETIADYLKLQWSPEQISGYLKLHAADSVSHETIYQYILEEKKSGGTLYRHLRHSGKKKKKRYGGSDRRGQITDRVSIEKRPKVVDKRTRVGDWEIDLVIGKNHKSAIVTVVDRFSLMTLIAKVNSKKAEEVSQAIIRLLKPYRTKAAHTITVDNGKEFSSHGEFAVTLGLDVYFAHPYSSWERGTNENMNGLIRQYLPKKTSFEEIHEQHCQWVMDRLNNRPRKCLDYRTPREVFEQCLDTS